MNYSEVTMEEYEAEVNRRLLNRRLRALGDLAGGVAFCALAVVLAWLYCLATPEQMSGECDWAASELAAHE